MFFQFYKHFDYTLLQKLCSDPDPADMATDRFGLSKMYNCQRLITVNRLYKCNSFVKDSKPGQLLEEVNKLSEFALQLIISIIAFIVK